MPSATNDTPTTWTCVDTSGMRHDPKVTESAGVVVGRPDNGYFTTHREEVAKEIQERYPHMLVTRHETSHGGRRTRSTLITMPRVPWETEWDRKHKQPTETQTGAVTPQEETPHVSEHTPQ